MVDGVVGEVRVVAVHRSQPVGQVAQLRRQALVTGDRVGPDGVATHRRDDLGVQEARRRGPVDEGQVPVPVIGLGPVGGVHRPQVRPLRGVLVDRVAQRQLPEPLDEGDLAVVVQRLVPEEDHFVLEQGTADLGDGRVTERPGRVDPTDLGADVPGEPGHGHLAHRSHGFQHHITPFRRQRFESILPAIATE
jgi:hypothetical protein